MVVAALLVVSLAQALVPPLIVVPGFTSSMLEYRLENAQQLSSFCNTTTDWQVLYPPGNLTLEQFVCYLEVYELFFDPKNRSFYNRPGVFVRTVDFGGFDGIPGLNFTVPFYEKEGWTLGKDLFGAPFDWRLPAWAHDDWFTDLQALVEHAYVTNGNRKVSILAPSGGPQFTVSFLHRMTQAWKDQYMGWFIAESPVFGGCPDALNCYISGLESELGKLGTFMARNSPGAVWLYPRAGTDSSVSWTQNDPFVLTPHKNYTAFDYLALYADLGFTINQSLVLDACVADADLLNFTTTGVDTFITYGTQVNTPGLMKFDQDFVQRKFPGAAAITNVSGDGLVPVRSSVRGVLWTDAQKQLGKQLLQKYYINQTHAYCLLPGGVFPGWPGDACYGEVMALLINGTIPPPNPPSDPDLQGPFAQPLPSLFDF